MSNVGRRGIEYLRGAQRELAAQLDQAAVADHRGLRGGARELDVRARLATLLPASVGLGRGEIIGHKGSRSREWDVVIYDSTQGEGPFRLGDATAFPVETVLAVVSVRTELDADHLRDLADQAAELRDFDRFPRHLARRAGDGGAENAPWPDDADPPPGVFALGGDGPTLETMRRTLLGRYGSALQEHGPSGSDFQLNGVAVLSRGYVSTATVLEAQPLQLVPFIRPQPGKHLVTVASPGDAFGLLVMALNYFVAYQPRVAPNITRYFDLSEVAGEIEASPLPI